jgi:radical S-adenosyl methionine domain-containing protein 2
MGRGTAGEITRGESAHLTRCLESWSIAKELGYGLKLNTVVTAHNKDDDMNSLVKKLSPHRWKVFQVLRVIGENEDTWDSLAVSPEEFSSWCERHARLDPVIESNELMRGSYCMIDPLLRFKTDAGGKLFYGRSIAEVGIDEAWQDIVNRGFSNDTFIKRGGVWSWNQ